MLRRDATRASPTPARGGFVHDVETGRHKGVPYTRPRWFRARCRDGTPQGRPLHPPAAVSCTMSRRDATRASPTPARGGFVHDVETGRHKGVPYTRPRWFRARCRDGTPQGRPLHPPAVVSCTMSRRDATRASPTPARGGFVHDVETGRHKGVPYTRPRWFRARCRDGTPQGRPLHPPAAVSCTMSRRDATRASPTPARGGFVHESETGRRRGGACPRPCMNSRGRHKGVHRPARATTRVAPTGSFDGAPRGVRAGVSRRQ